MASFTTSDGLALHFTDEGQGLPVLCLAGLTRDGRDFDFVAPHLSDIRLIRLDARGRGRSARADPSTYTPAIEARDALELIDHLGLDRVALLGTSRGGIVAMVLAATAHDRLLGVALNDVGPEVDPRGLDAILTYIGRNPAHKTHSDLLMVWPDIIRGFANVPESRFRAEIARLFDEAPEGLRITYDPRLRDAVLSAAAQPSPDLWPLFDALAGLPLAVIRGANSDILAPQTLAEMRRRRPDMIVAEVPDRGHIPYLDEAESLAALRQWMKRL